MYKSGNTYWGIRRDTLCFPLMGARTPVMTGTVCWELTLGMDRTHIIPFIPLLPCEPGMPDTKGSNNEKTWFSNHMGKWRIAILLVLMKIIKPLLCVASQWSNSQKHKKKTSSQQSLMFTVWTSTLEMTMVLLLTTAALMRCLQGPGSMPEV